MAEEVKNIGFKKLFDEAVLAWNQNLKSMVVASVIVCMFLEVGFCLLGGWANPLFLPWGILLYLFWYGFFRFVFGRKPYLKNRRFWESLIPATKIVMLAFIFATFLLLLPYAPYAMNVPVEVKENYELFQKRYMQDGDAYDVVLNIIFVLMAPQVILRPFMAWLNAIIGRSWSIMTAWNRTQGSYFVFFVLAMLIDIFYFSFVFLVGGGVPLWLVWILAAPLIVFVNLLISRIYIFYFLV